jgi:hypothetical protein
VGVRVERQVRPLSPALAKWTTKLLSFDEDY